MTAFQTVWNQAIPQGVMPDILGAITEQTLNNYLTAHRRFDPEKYKFSKTFTGDRQARFSIDVTVEAPLQVDLPPFSTSGHRNVTKIAEFPSPPRSRRSAGDDANQIRVYADNNTFHFSWTTSSGKSFSHDLQRVKFRLDAEAQIVTDGSKHNLKFQATALYIDQGQLRKMIRVWRERDPSCEEKLDALFLSMLQVVAAQIATSLKDTIEIPVIDMGVMRLYASALALKSKTVVLGASADVDAMAQGAQMAMQADRIRVQRAFESDLEHVGGIVALVFSRRTLARARSLDAASAERFLVRAETRTPEEIWKDLKATREVVEQLEHRSNLRRSRVRKKRGRRMTPSDVGLGVGVAEKLLQALATKVIPVDQHNCTDELSLGFIKGRACANVHVWNPVITIGSDGLHGAVNMDIWAGIEYYWKKFWDCSWSWDGPHQIGLGLTGVPRITLATIPAEGGLSINATFDLRDVHLKTGISDLIDKIIAALDGPFIAILQVILNAIAGLLTFVVVPVRITIPGQKTGLRLSRFDTSLYVRTQPGIRLLPAAGRLNYLAVDCAANPVQVQS